MIEHAPDIDGISEVPSLAEDPAMGLPQRQ